VFVAGGSVDIGTTNKEGALRVRTGFSDGETGGSSTFPTIGLKIMDIRGNRD